MCALQNIFPVQIKHVQTSSIQLEKEKSLLNDVPLILLCFNTPRGDFYVVVQFWSERDLVLCYDSDASELDHFACVKITPGSSAIVSFSSITPLVCANCNAPLEETRLLKCGWCWETLAVCVCYCSRQCQIAHYGNHKRICGKAD